MVARPGQSGVSLWCSLLLPRLSSWDQNRRLAIPQPLSLRANKAISGYYLAVKPSESLGRFTWTFDHTYLVVWPVGSTAHLVFTSSMSSASMFEEDLATDISVAFLCNLSTIQLPGLLLCPGTHTTVNEHLDASRLRILMHSLANLEVVVLNFRDLLT